jgi:hypothetical protein
MGKYCSSGPNLKLGNLPLPKKKFSHYEKIFIEMKTSIMLIAATKTNGI